MGLFLKALSLLSGSSEETLLNARAEMSNKFGKGILSNETEREYVFEQLYQFILINGVPRELEHESTGVIIGTILDYLTQDKKNTPFIQVSNRVMVDYYNYEFGSTNSLITALTMMGQDFEHYVKIKERR